MEYSILQMAKLAGISTRTLRYYDKIGLLTPLRNPASGYRIYREAEVDLLQQILFYKELGFELSAIEEIVKSPDFNCTAALHEHLKRLEEKEANIRLLIDTVKKTIQKEEGTIQMTDNEKFIGLKKSMVEENETAYGKETRKAYGDDVVDKSNEKFLNLSQEEYRTMQETAKELQTKLEEAVRSHANPDGQEGKEIALLHKKWLSFTWNFYSADAHKGLAEMYVADERFTAHYDKEVAGCAQFLRDAICAHVGK